MVQLISVLYDTRDSTFHQNKNQTFLRISKGSKDFLFYDMVYNGTPVWITLMKRSNSLSRPVLSRNTINVDHKLSFAMGQPW